MIQTSLQNVLRIFSITAALCAGLLASPAHAVSVGDVAPEFEAVSLRENMQVQLSSYRGRVVYLEFWASWCPPCWDAFPLLEQVNAELHGEGIEVIGVNVNDDLSDAKKSIKKIGVSFPLVRPQDDAVMQAYDIKAMPYGVLIDRKGVVRYTNLGLKKSNLYELKKMIRRLQWTGL